eukprot:3313195-Amphidinium_carterae.1
MERVKYASRPCNQFTCSDSCRSAYLSCTVGVTASFECINLAKIELLAYSEFRYVAEVNAQMTPIQCGNCELHIDVSAGVDLKR